MKARTRTGPARALGAAHAALDARRDPWSEPELLAALEVEPEAYAEVERLLARLDVIARVPLAPPTEAATRVAPIVRMTTLAAGALLALGLGLLAATMPERAPAPRGVRTGSASAASSSLKGGEVLDFHVAIARTTPTERSVVFNDNGVVTRERTYTGTGRTAAAPESPRVTIRRRTVAANRRRP